MWSAMGMSLGAWAQPWWGKVVEVTVAEPVLGGEQLALGDEDNSDGVAEPVQ